MVENKDKVTKKMNNNIKLILFATTGLSLAVFLGFRIVEKSAEIRNQASGGLESITVVNSVFENIETQWPLKQGNGSTVSRSSDKKYRGNYSALFNDANDFLDKNIRLQNGVVTAYFYDDLSSNVKFFFGAQNTNLNPTQTIAVGVRTEVYQNHYHIRNGESSSTYDLNSQIPRTQGWHKVELVITPKGSYAKIDDISLAYLGKSNQASGVNPKLTQVNHLFIANQMDGAKVYVDDYTFTRPPFLQALPSAKETELHFLEMYRTLQTRPAFDASNPGTTSRLVSLHGLVHAILYKSNSSLFSSSLNEAKYAMNTLLDNQSKWTSQFTHQNSAYNIGLTGWLIHSKLSSSERSKLKDFVRERANVYANETPLSGYDGDTKAEENSWNSSFLGLAGWMYPNDSNTTKWRDMRGTFTNHIFTEKPTNRYGYTTQTLYGNYDLANHNYRPHPQYALASIGQITRSSLPIIKTNSGAYTGGYVTDQVANVWNRHKIFYDFNTFLLKDLDMANRFEGKDDWYTDLGWSNHALYILDDLGIDNTSYEDVRTKQWYLFRDYLAFPRTDDLWIKSGTIVPLSGTAGVTNRKMLDAEAAGRHGLTFLLLSPEISLQGL